LFLSTGSDLVAVFDTVDNTILLKRLVSASPVGHWIRSYLSHRTQYICSIGVARGALGARASPMVRENWGQIYRGKL